MTVNPFELACNLCFLEVETLNELRNLNVLSWIIDFFYHLSVLNNNFKEIMNCKSVIGKLYQL